MYGTAFGIQRQCVNIRPGDQLSLIAGYVAPLVRLLMSELARGK